MSKLTCHTSKFRVYTDTKADGSYIPEKRGKEQNVWLTTVAKPSGLVQPAPPPPPNPTRPTFEAKPKKIPTIAPARSGIPPQASPWQVYPKKPMQKKARSAGAKIKETGSATTSILKLQSSHQGKFLANKNITQPSPRKQQATGELQIHQYVATTKISDKSRKSSRKATDKSDTPSLNEQIIFRIESAHKPLKQDKNKEQRRQEVEEFSEQLYELLQSTPISFLDYHRELENGVLNNKDPLPVPSQTRPHGTPVVRRDDRNDDVDNSDHYDEEDAFLLMKYTPSANPDQDPYRQVAYSKSVILAAALDYVKHQNQALEQEKDEIRKEDMAYRRIAVDIKRQITRWRRKVEEEEIEDERLKLSQNSPI